MSRYDGKRVVITGGTSGIGLATARLMLQRGARVLVTGRSTTTLDHARHQLGGQVVTVQSDAASLADIDALAQRVHAQFGPLDALFLNAASTRLAAFEDITEAVYDELLANAKGPYFTVQKLAPLMSRGSAVVLTTSILNNMGYPGHSAYAASKAALRSMARSLGRELLPRGIRVNAVSPGPIDTASWDKTLPSDAPSDAEQLKAQAANRNPMGRMGRPEEVAEAVAFLAFEATYCTGVELIVDGGASQL